MNRTAILDLLGFLLAVGVAGAIVVWLLIWLF